MENHLITNPSPAPPSSSPTTFVQADTTSFRDLVQKLTGFSGDSEKLPVTHLSKLSSSKPLPPSAAHLTGPHRSPFKLQERRHTIRKLEIKLGLTENFNNSPPSHTHRFDSPVPCPVTPLASESLFFLRPGVASPLSPPFTTEDKAITDGGFYLHPSPINTPRISQMPELLNLFPSDSPRQQYQNA